MPTSLTASPFTFGDMPHHRSTQPYSLARAVVRALENDGEPDGLELEVSQELSRRTGRTARGFLVPWDAPATERRNLSTVAGPGSITGIIPQGMLIDSLRPKLACARLGAQVLNLISGDGTGLVQLPVKQLVSTISWVSEGSPPASQSNFTVASQLLTPHTATAFTDVNRRMISLGQPGFEQFVIDDIMTGIAVAVDAAALNGTGTNNQPLGLCQILTGQPSVGAANDSGNGGKPAYVDLVAMERAIGQANGDSPCDCKLGFVTSPAGRSALRRCDLGGSTVTGRYAWKSHPCYNPVTGQLEFIETCVGYPAVATTNVPSNLTEGSGTGLTSGIMGNFNDMIINLFSGFDCLVNPYLQSTNGVVRVSGFQDVDVCLRRFGSFATCTGWVTS